MQYNHYKILDVQYNASADELKKAYRAKAKIVHPDVNNSPQANEMFAALNNAYEVLSDDNKRYVFDLKLKYGTTMPPPKPKHPDYGKTYSTKADVNFHYDWQSFRKVNHQKRDEGFFRITPFIYNMFFASGMFTGFLITIPTLGAIFSGYWPSFMIVAAVPGVILITEGWIGINGKRSVVKRVASFCRRLAIKN